MRRFASTVVLAIAGMALIGAFLSTGFPVKPAGAQQIPKALQEGGPDAQIKERKNAWTVGLAGGLLGGTYMTFADEIAKVLDDGDNLRVLPFVSYGAASNLDDLLYLRGVDVAMTQSDVFEFFRTQRKTFNLEKRINYIIRLPISEMHIVASDSIQSLEDLRGKKVNFGPVGTAASLTGTIVFNRLGIEVEQVTVDNASALQKIKSGEIAALVRVVGKPVDFVSKIPPNSGVHLLQIPFGKQFADFYTLGEFTNKDYPNLVPEGERIDTIAVPAVLAVYNWPKDSDRYRKVERFVEQIFAKWDKFQKPPFHPKWREINLAATVPGWTRWSVAEQMLEKMGSGDQASDRDLNKDFEGFLARSDHRGNFRNPAEREALFREFMQWREQHHGQQ